MRLPHHEWEAYEFDFERKDAKRQKPLRPINQACSQR